MAKEKINCEETVNSNALLALLPNCVICVTRDFNISYANAAAEDFLGESFAVLKSKKLDQFLRPSTHVMELVELVFSGKSLLKEYDVPLSGRQGGIRNVNIQILPLEKESGSLIVIDDRGTSHHMPQRESSRLTSGMASILAHEVKNPLSGIRGAAQLLHKIVSDEDCKLTSLIVDEVDRIKHLIEEMEIFSNPSDLKTESLNIHEILQYVILLAGKGFARHVKFRETYDPSLPDVLGNRNLLIQLFVNLVKNASEAVLGQKNPVITFTTYYKSGFRFKAPGTQESRALPVVVCVEDNGPGIPKELRESIFDPFVTTKEGGKGSWAGCGRQNHQ